MAGNQVWRPSDSPVGHTSDRGGVKFKTVSLPVKTRVGVPEGQPPRETTATVEVPASLKDAIAIEGENMVFKRYVQSLAIEIQGEHRRQLQEKKPGERRKAGYMEELGI